MAIKEPPLKEDVACGVRIVHQSLVARARERAIPLPELRRLALVFQILGDSNRLKMILALREIEMCVCDLAAFLGLTESAVSHQLRRLKDLGMVKKRRAGQVLYYSLDDPLMTEILDLGLEHLTEARAAV